MVLVEEHQLSARATKELSSAQVLTVEVDGERINASGHREQLRRQYGMLHTIEIMLMMDSAWIFFAVSLTLAINAGGGPGVIFELLLACFYYSFVAASLAELGSGMPSSGGVYHYASVAAGPRYGRVVGFFTGFLNCFAWILNPTGIVNTISVVIIQLYSLWHPNYVQGDYEIFVIDIIVIWLSAAFCILFNRWIPLAQRMGAVCLLGGGLATIIVLAVMPKSHASNDFVWGDFDNRTGYPGGVAFLIGVINGAITIGTPESISHISEELPNPTRDIPIGILCQMVTGTISAFAIALALLYSITDLDYILQNGGLFPLTQIYLQATGSLAATTGLLIIVLLCLIACLLPTIMNTGRNCWALARDGATPFPRFFSVVDEKKSCPIRTTILIAAIATALSAISIGSPTAQTDLLGSGIMLTATTSVLPVAANLLTGRRYVPKGWFHMGQHGWYINAIAVACVFLFDIFFCFPSAIPVTVAYMNYNSVIVTGFVSITAFWWFAHARKHYPGAALNKIYQRSPSSDS